MEQVLSELSEFEKRLASALARLSAGVERVSPRSGDPAADGGTLSDDHGDAQREALLAAQSQELSSVTAAFEAQLARVTAELADKDEKIVQQSAEIARLAAAAIEPAQPATGDLEKDNASLLKAMKKLESSRAQLKAANASLRANNKELRAALTEGLADPALVNAGLEATLKALEADRAAEQSDAQAFVDLVTPLLEEAPNA